MYAALLLLLPPPPTFLPQQNVSGLNRHATQQQVLQDPKNRLVTCYLRIVEFLRPRFLLMEQVGGWVGVREVE